MGARENSREVEVSCNFIFVTTDLECMPVKVEIVIPTDKFPVSTHTGMYFIICIYVCVYMCACTNVCEKERKREWGWVGERERGRERERERERECACVSESVCACLKSR